MLFHIRNKHRIACNLGDAIKPVWGCKILAGRTVDSIPERHFQALHQGIKRGANLLIPQIGTKIRFHRVVGSQDLVRLHSGFRYKLSQLPKRLRLQFLSRIDKVVCNEHVYAYLCRITRHNIHVKRGQVSESSRMFDHKKSAKALFLYLNFSASPRRSRDSAPASAQPHSRSFLSAGRSLQPGHAGSAPRQSTCCPGG